MTSELYAYLQREEKPAVKATACVWRLDHSTSAWRGCTSAVDPWYSPEEWQYCPLCGKPFEVQS